MPFTAERPPERPLVSHPIKSSSRPIRRPSHPIKSPHRETSNPWGLGRTMKSDYTPRDRRPTPLFNPSVPTKSFSRVGDCKNDEEIEISSQQFNALFNQTDYFPTERQSTRRKLLLDKPQMPQWDSVESRVMRNDLDDFQLDEIISPSKTSAHKKSKSIWKTEPEKLVLCFHSHISEL